MTRQVGQNQNLRRTYFYRPIRLGRQNILIDIFRFSVMSYKVTFYIPIFPQHKTARGISSWITIKKLREISSGIPQVKYAGPRDAIWSSQRVLY